MTPPTLHHTAKEGYPISEDGVVPPLLGLPYGQFLRLKRICTQETDFKKHSLNMKQNFINRGYPEKPLDKNIEKCTTLDCKDLLMANKPPSDEKKNSDNIYMVQTFRPCKNSLTDIIKRNWDILGRSRDTKNIHRSTLTSCYKKTK